MFQMEVLCGMRLLLILALTGIILIMVHMFEQPQLEVRHFLNMPIHKKNGLNMKKIISIILMLIFSLSAEAKVYQIKNFDGSKSDIDIKLDDAVQEMRVSLGNET